MSAWALAVCAIATLLTWLLYAGARFSTVYMGREGGLLVLILFGMGVLVPLLSGLWVGSTKSPSLPWFSSPHRWLRPGGRSVLEIAMFGAGMPAGVAIFIPVYIFSALYLLLE
jgi:hypothetical protein